MKNTTERCSGIEEISGIIERLLGENGCPWDRKQTPESVQTYLVEESHEAAAAVRAGNAEEVAEELGDVLFMVYFLIHLYERRGDFSAEEVYRLICEKMIRRHPHVFGEMSVNSAKEVKDNWEKIKADEKRESGKTDGSVPDSLPALIRAHRIISRLSQKNDGDWNDLRKQGKVFLTESDRLAAEIENERAIPSEDMGRALARLVNIARLQGLRSEDVLHDFLKQLESGNG